MVVLAVVVLMLPVQPLLALETLLALLPLKEIMEEPEQRGRRLEAQAVAVLEQPAQTVALQAETAAMEPHLAFLARLLHTQAAVVVVLIRALLELAAQAAVETVA
jgi:hypothetical protein